MSRKTVLITGSTRGIGLEFAKQYVEAGWKVIGAARAGSNTDKLNSLGDVQIVTIDACDEMTIQNAAEELKGVPIDLLINNAGIYIETLIETVTKETLMSQYEVNTVGPFLITRALLPNLKLAPSSIVAHVSSYMGSITNNLGEAYGYRASKAALNMINSCLAIDLKPSSITAVVLHPGYVVTDLTFGLGNLQADESVKGMIHVLGKVTIADTGRFLHFQGHEIAW